MIQFLKIGDVKVLHMALIAGKWDLPHASNYQATEKRRISTVRGILLVDTYLRRPEIHFVPSERLRIVNRTTIGV